MRVQTLPGTNIHLPQAGYSVDMLLNSLFLAGGLMLSQICGLTDLPPYMLQNWVKRGFVPPPVNKKYTQNQFCRVAIINGLKNSLRIDIIAKLIRYASTHGDETTLYICFARAVMLADNDLNKLEKALEDCPPGLRDIVKAMAIFYISAQIKTGAELLLANLGILDISDIED